MGYVERYRQEAAERNIPNWQRVVIAQAGENTQEAIVARHGYGSNWPHELPLRFPSYETAFEWVERKLTQRAPDKSWDAAVQPELFDLALLPYSKFNTSLPSFCR
jgi:hypothetical protein